MKQLQIKCHSFLLITLFVITRTVMADNFVVDNTGGGTFCEAATGAGTQSTTLAQARLDANTAVGIPHTIRICPGAGPYTAANAFRNANYDNMTITGTTGDAADVVINGAGGEVIEIRDPINVTIQDLTLSGGTDGIEFRDANGGSVTNVVINNPSARGIFVRNSTGVTLTTVTISNVGTNEGIYFNAASTSAVINTAVVDTTTQDCIEIDSTGADLDNLTLSNCTQRGLRLDATNITVDNASIDTTGQHGISITQDGASLTDITINNGGTGDFDGINTTRGELTLLRVSVSNAADFGIHVNNSNTNRSNVDLSDITITTTGDDGLFINRITAGLTVDDVTITGSADRGMYLNRTNDGVLTRLDITNNTNYGLYLNNSRRNDISLSEISSNGSDGADAGIYLVANARDNIIHSNRIENNARRGIRIRNNNTSDGNEIYENCFTNPTALQNARDEETGGTNTFDDGTSRGNYWGSENGGSGHSETCPDVGSDGICDTTFAINGAGGSVDNFPLVNCPLDQNIVFSTETDAAVGALNFQDEDAVEYDGTNTTVVFDGTAEFTADEDIDALHIGTDGHIYFSTEGNADIGALAIQDDDVIEYDPDTGTSTKFFDLDDITAADEELDALYIGTNGHIYFSTEGNANIGALAVEDDDVIEYDPVSGTSTKFFDADDITTADEDVDAFHLVLGNGNILFSVEGNADIGALAVQDDDVIEYNPNTGVSTKFFDADDITTADEDIDAITINNPFFETPVNHYAITYDNGAIGVTCEASKVTITAHDSSDNPVNVPAGTVMTLNAFIDGTTTNTGTWDNVTVGNGTLALNPGNPVTYTWPSPEESSFTIDLRQISPQTIDIDLADDTTPGGGLEKGDGDNSDPEDPTIEFRDAIFRVVDSSAAAATITTKLSGKQSNTVGTSFQELYLQAIETVSSTECTGVFEDEADVIIQMAFECNNPTACETIEVQVEDDVPALVSIDDNANGSVTVYQDIQFDFDTDSKTPLNFIYDDAGQITFHARYDIDPSAATDYMVGTSNAFIVKPAGICIENVPADVADAACSPASSSCNIFRDAGEVFDLIVRGVTWEGDADTDFCNTAGSGNVTTPNFEITGIELNSTVVEPSSGSDGTLSVTSIDILDADKGTDTHTQSIDEVGVFTITASGNAAMPTTAITYLSETIPASTTINIGRFIPNRLVVVSNGSPAFANECSTGTAFTYLDQGFNYGTAPVLTLEARATDGTTVTENYDDTSFMKLGLTDLDRSYTDNSGLATVNLTTILDDATPPLPVTVSGLDDYDGQVILTMNNGTDGDTFAYGRLALQSEFNADITATFTSFTGASNTDDLNDDDDVCVGDGTNCIDYSIANISGARLLFGRLFIGTAIGSELLPLQVRFQTEYYDGTSFQPNGDDGCTLIDDVAPVNAIPDIELTNLIDGTETDGTIQICAAGGTSTFTLANPTLVAGDGGLSFSAPGATCIGYSEIGLDLTTIGINYLQYDWIADDASFDDDPTGRVDFGLFEGPSEYIYIREPW